jgi:hypothetical protein
LPQYCPACARRQYALWGGYKRACASSLAHAHETSADFVRPLLGLDSSAAGAKEDQLVDGRDECPTTGTLSNFSVSPSKPRGPAAPADNRYSIRGRTRL